MLVAQKDVPLLHEQALALWSNRTWAALVEQDMGGGDPTTVKTPSKHAYKLTIERGSQDVAFIVPRSVLLNTFSDHSLSADIATKASTIHAGKSQAKEECDAPVANPCHT